MFAMMNARRNWFSARTWPRLMRRYSTARPQQPPRRLERKFAERRIGIQAEVGNSGEEFAIRFYFQERADGDESLSLGIVLKNLLHIVEAAGRDLEVAEDRRQIAGTESESEGRD